MEALDAVHQESGELLHLVRRENGGLGVVRVGLQLSVGLHLRRFAYDEEEIGDPLEALDHGRQQRIGVLFKHGKRE